MEENRRTTGRGGRRKKRWTKRRIRRYVRAWIFRILFALGILLVLGLLISGVRLAAKAVIGAGSKAADQAESVTDESGAETESETEAAAAAEPVITTVTLTATGDCTLGTTQTQKYSGSFTEYYDKNGADYFFQNIRDIFEADDFTIVNLESVLTEATEQKSKSESGTVYYLKGLPEYTKILSGSSVEAASLGNNHIEDYGEQGTTDTEANLDAAGIKWALNETVGTYTTADGIVIGFVSEATIPNSEEKEQVFLDGIQKLKDQGVNLIICCCHWGSEKKNYPKDYQVELAHDLIDAGADLIIGNHPHVLQGFEIYKGKVICYSLGNCSFGGNRNPFSYESVLYQQTFTFSDGLVQTGVDAQVIPCYISSSTKANDYQPTIAAGDDKQTILDHVNTYSEGVGDVTFDSDGKLSSPSLTQNTTAGSTESSDASGESSSDGTGESESGNASGESSSAADTTA